MYQITCTFVYNYSVLNKHQQKTEATKAKLFHAAQRVFARRGFEAATIDQIARSAGFSRGAFYAHFKTKEDVFLGMLEERASRDMAEFRRALTSSTRADWAGVIWRICKEKLRDTEWAVLQLEFKLYIARQGARGVKIAERYQNLRENMRQQYLDDIVPADPAKHAIFEALTDGLALQRAYKRAQFSEADAEHAMRRAFDGLLRLDE